LWLTFLLTIYYFMFRNKLTLPILIIVLILAFDQFIKIYVKTHFYLGESYAMAGTWFYLHFTENPGMAYGLEFGGVAGKYFLSVFRILLSIGIFYYLVKQAKENAHSGFLICLAMIFAGAVGNIIDSMFYGLSFSESGFEAAHTVPFGTGYASFLRGSVVDMFYFPLIQGHFPAWFPIWGGEEFEFFRPIFNFADFAISTGVVTLILFQKKFFQPST
jgi:signal peptidase II